MPIWKKSEGWNWGQKQLWLVIVTVLLNIFIQIRSKCCFQIRHVHCQRLGDPLKVFANLNLWFLRSSAHTFLKRVTPASVGVWKYGKTLTSGTAAIQVIEWFWQLYIYQFCRNFIAALQIRFYFDVVSHYHLEITGNSNYTNFPTGN